jgi:hypothetical protein
LKRLAKLNYLKQKCPTNVGHFIFIFNKLKRLLYCLLLWLLLLLQCYAEKEHSD